jgi:hypothetical protein
MFSIVRPNLKKLFLTENMRLNNLNLEDKEFTEWAGKMLYNLEFHGSISLSPFIKKTNDVEAFIEDIYPKSVLQNPLKNSMFFKERAILSPKNKHC